MPTTVGVVEGAVGGADLHRAAVAAVDGDDVVVGQHVAVVGEDDARAAAGARAAGHVDGDHAGRRLRRGRGRGGGGLRVLDDDALRRPPAAATPGAGSSTRAATPAPAPPPMSAPATRPATPMRSRPRAGGGCRRQDRRGAAPGNGPLRRTGRCWECRRAVRGVRPRRRSGRRCRPSPSARQGPAAGGVARARTGTAWSAAGAQALGAAGLPRAARRGRRRLAGRS